MASADDARTYLADFLAAHGIELKAASLALGRNHAYLQQYISAGKPRWLNEQDRETLVRLYGIDGDKLKPAWLHASKTVPHGHHERKVHPPGYGKFVDDPRTLDLLDIWADIPEDRRELALRILRNLAPDSNSVVA